MSLQIHVTTYNRKVITGRCLQIIRGYAPGVPIHIHDDGSSEYDVGWLSQFTLDITQSKKLNIDKIMLNKFIEFKHSNYDFLYSCDNDILHDPAFLDVAMDLFEKYKLPLLLCL